MPREKITSILTTPFSHWHRQQHNGVAYLDLDYISVCPACATPLFIADQIYNKDNKCTPKSDWINKPYRILAERANLDFYTIWYSVDESTNARTVTSFAVKNQLKDLPIKFLTPDEMLQFLEYKVIKHIPTCNSKKYLEKRVTEKNQYNKNFRRLNKYVEVFNN